MLREARAFAIAAHEAIGQRRKWTNEPYWRHCERVVNIIRDHASNRLLRVNTLVLCAAWMHDTVEDTQIENSHIEGLFGYDVASLVAMVTDASKPEDGNREVRRRIDREHLGRATPFGKSIKLADMIDNTQSVSEHDPNFAVVYLKEKELMLPFLKEGDPGLFALATKTLQIAQHKLVQDNLQKKDLIHGS